MSAQEEAIMEKAIITTYSLKGITFDDDSIIGKQIPIMSDLEDVLDTMDGAKSLVTRIQKFTTGIFAGIFSQHTNIDLKE
ncbi:MAG: hypothetical protein ACPHY8_02320 [Patescibacteria group bacterium]